MKKPNKIVTLAFLVKQNQLLLAMKKRGFGKGKWNGYGGKVGRRESPKEAARRELSEESGITKAELEEVGLLHFYEPSVYWLCHVFISREFKGEPKETEEMFPRWFNFEQIPYSRMWEDDPHWLPYVLKGKSVEGHFWFGKDWKGLQKHKIKVE